MPWNNQQYEYIAVYVDDLAFAMEDTHAFIGILPGKYKFKIKEAGPLSFHLGADFYREEDGTLCMAPQKYIDRLAANYGKIFGEKPSSKNVLTNEKRGSPRT